MPTIARKLNEEIEDGREVILNLGEDVKPEKVLKILSFLQDEYEVELVVRHAELREYIEHVVAGAAVGGAVGAGGAILTALAAGNPITLGPVLVAAGIGALAGAIGAGATEVHRVTVYKHRGETRIKVAAA
jgi:predicted phage tail protein